MGMIGSPLILIFELQNPMKTKFRNLNVNDFAGSAFRVRIKIMNDRNTKLCEVSCAHKRN